MFRGIPVSEGIGIGKAYVISGKKPEYEKRNVKNTTAEKERFRMAVKTFCEERENMAAKLEAEGSLAQADILRGHIMMIQDPFMTSQIEDQIDTGICAEQACEEELGIYREMFLSVGDEITEQRAADVDDICCGVIGILTGCSAGSVADIPPGSVIVVEELTPSMTAEMNKANVVGIVAEKGGMTSHSAIIARSLGIPAVLSVPGAMSEFVNQLNVIVDGNDGIVFPDPCEDTLNDYRAQKKFLDEEREGLKAYENRPTETADGTKHELCCNVGNLNDATDAAESGGDGIGLFRTEFLFMSRDSMPDEELQFETYKKAAELFKDKEPGNIIIRTLDIGGDKAVPYLEMKEEDNPFLGFRAIRYCLENTELFKTQLRAILRASAFGNIKIMVPLVTEVTEMVKVRQLVDNIKTDLDEEKIDYDKNIQVGAMIETPSASLIADLLAKECDFFSIGTNDLTQYTMAADRGNSEVTYLNNYLEPSVIRSIKHIIECAKCADIPVGMCGEAAADPLMIPLLIAFGLDEFSVSPKAVLKTRYNISRWSVADAKDIAEHVLTLSTAGEIQRYLRRTVYNK